MLTPSQKRLQGLLSGMDGKGNAEHVERSLEAVGKLHQLMERRVVKSTAQSKLVQPRFVLVNHNDTTLQSLRNNNSQPEIDKIFLIREERILGNEYFIGYCDKDGKYQQHPVTLSDEIKKKVEQNASKAATGPFQLTTNEQDILEYVEDLLTTQENVRTASLDNDFYDAYRELVKEYSDVLHVDDPEHPDNILEKDVQFFAPELLKKQAEILRARDEELVKPETLQAAKEEAEQKLQAMEARRDKLFADYQALNTQKNIESQNLQVLQTPQQQGGQVDAAAVAAKEKEIAEINKKIDKINTELTPMCGGDSAQSQGEMGKLRQKIDAYKFPSGQYYLAHQAALQAWKDLDDAINHNIVTSAVILKYQQGSQLVAAAGQQQQQQQSIGAVQQYRKLIEDEHIYIEPVRAPSTKAKGRVNAFVLSGVDTSTGYDYKILTSENFDIVRSNNSMPTNLTLSSSNQSNTPELYSAVLGKKEFQVAVKEIPDPNNKNEIVARSMISYDPRKQEVSCQSTLKNIGDLQQEAIEAAKMYLQNYDGKGVIEIRGNQPEQANRVHAALLALRPDLPLDKVKNLSTPRSKVVEPGPKSLSDRIPGMRDDARREKFIQAQLPNYTTNIEHAKKTVDASMEERARLAAERVRASKAFSQGLRDKGVEESERKRRERDFQPEDTKMNIPRNDAQG